MLLSLLLLPSVYGIPSIPCLFKVVQMASSKRELEKKMEEQEEELDEQAGQIQLLEQVG